MLCIILTLRFLARLAGNEAERVECGEFPPNDSSKLEGWAGAVVSLGRIATSLQFSDSIYKKFSDLNRICVQLFSLNFMR